MLTHERTMELIALAKCGDEFAKETLTRENAPLIKSLIRRFRGRGVDYDDLYQLACLGLIKAVNNFDDKFGVKFSTYAVPMIVGEVKRFLRDDGYVKVSRSIKVLASDIAKYIEEFKGDNLREPKIAEIADYFDMSPHDIVFAMGSSKHPISLFEKFDDGDGKGAMLIDKVMARENSVAIDDSIILRDAIDMLDEREKKIIILRYYRDKTQGEIAEYFGLSQVQISRIESRIIKKIREKF